MDTKESKNYIKIILKYLESFMSLFINIMPKPTMYNSNFYNNRAIIDPSEKN